MQFARAMAIACISALKWMCWFVSALLLVLTVVQALRGDADRNPSTTMALGGAFAAAALICRYAVKRFETAV
jgi:hypothetical protein